MTSQEPDPEALSREELQQYRELFRLAPIGIIRTTKEGKVLAGNQAFAEMLGFADFQEYASLTAKMATDLYEDPQMRLRFLKEQAESCGSLHFESRWRKKDGSPFDCRLHVRASMGQSGDIRYFEGFIEDISRQKEIEAALHESAERYRSVFENTGNATIIFESDTTISLANERAVALTGYSKEELEGKIKWPVLIAKPEDLERMMRYHVSRRRGIGNIPIEYEFTLKDKAGVCKEVFLRVDLIAGTEASVASMLDITSLKSARRKLLESTSRLSGILEAFEGYIYICTADRKLVFMNRKQKEAAAGEEDLPCHQRLYGLGEPCPWCDAKKVFQGQTVKYEFQHPTDGRWYYAVSSPVYAEEHFVSQKQTVLIDIHARRIAEEALKERETYLAKENLRLRENIRDRYKFGAIIGKSLGMQKVYELILRAAATSANVILYGESGTGKELVASAIHEMSDRAAGPLVPVNCAAIPVGLMESEFFGYRKGAFTGADKNKPGFFAQADHGTLFLDELGEIDEAMQVKLLRVLEGNGYMVLGGQQRVFPEVRIIAATNRNLRSLLDSGRMREDFFYRIHIIPIAIPPLRDRREDIPLLVEHFLKKYERPGSPALLSGNDLEKLMRHTWPGNVRELENTIQRYVNLNVLEFPGREDKPVDTAGKLAVPSAQVSLREATRNFEREFLHRHLTAHRWNRTKVASLLGIQRKTLYLKMRQLDLLDEGE
ncbi:MAG: sigma-54 dependent DNA-binding response regulator [uncultured bacterium]|nr:MAG: sigma-54 dependent DNA-binding response regulator [uncultured bacterium]